MPTSGRPACPHCGSDRTLSHGSFGRKDGSREPRRLCHACGRSFCHQTGTPAYYIKKREQWAQMPRAMVAHRALRRVSAVLGVQLATAFRWRHRLLGAIARLPQPGPTREVAIAAAFVRYSEKGSRNSNGPGAWRKGIRRSQAKPFRFIADGKPSCVLVAHSSRPLRTVITGQGRPSLTTLAAALAQLLIPGGTVWTDEFVAPLRHCHSLGYVALRSQTISATQEHPSDEAVRHLWHLQSWLHDFHGVATRYLAHYLAWFRHYEQYPERALAA